MTVAETDRAWAAGFFDADGSTTVGGKLDKNGVMRLSVRCQLGQAEQQWDDLERFARVVGVGRISDKGPRHDHRPGTDASNWSPYKNWQAQSLEAVAVCQNILWPYLGEYKRARWEANAEKARESRSPVVPGQGAPIAPKRVKE